jgi:hypothetical protein
VTKARHSLVVGFAARHHEIKVGSVFHQTDWYGVVFAFAKKDAIPKIRMYICASGHYAD